MTTVRLQFSSGAEADVPIGDGETVLAAAIRAGIPIRHQCENGICGSCAARLIEGDCQMDEGDAPALLPSEIRAGYRLLCVTKAMCDHASFAFDYALAAQPSAEISRFTACVTEIDRLSASVVHLALVITEKKPFAFQPGQYVRLQVPGSDCWRSYSIASTVDELPRIDLLIRLVDGGVMSRWLADVCRVGDEMALEGSCGRFVLQNNRGLHVMVAGGTGLAPLLSMIDTLHRRPGPRPPILLCFGCNTNADLFYEVELDERTFSLPNVEVRVAVANDQPVSLGVRRGTAVSLLEEPDLRRSGATFYFCGPPAMVAAARERVARAGVSHKAVFSEQFLPSAG